LAAEASVSEGGKAPPEPPSRASLKRECAIASVGILLALALIKGVLPSIPIIGEHAMTLAAALQLYVPILLIGRRGISRESLGLTADRWAADLRWVAILGLLTALPFALAHHAWQVLVFHRVLRVRLAPGLMMSVLTQVLAVALPEELFYRGYLQQRFEAVWPARRRLFGTPFGSAIIVTSAVFALAHFVGEGRLDRLGPFFPGLVFGLLRTRTRSLVAPVAYHAFCNVLSEILFACYF
jgi:membrane protease YdiL (CAAX protease family)